MDSVTKEIRKKTIQAIRSNNTSIEIKFRKALFANGVRFRKNVKNLVGKPDIAWKRKKIVVFLDSCFWHSCPIHFRKPKSNVEYWEKKIDRNIKRDLYINTFYLTNGWKLFRFWEHDIKENFEVIVNKVIKKYEASL